MANTKFENSADMKKGKYYEMNFSYVIRCLGYDLEDVRLSKIYQDKGIDFIATKEEKLETDVKSIQAETYKIENTFFSIEMEIVKENNETIKGWFYKKTPYIAYIMHLGNDYFNKQKDDDKGLFLGSYQLFLINHENLSKLVDIFQKNNKELREVKDKVLQHRKSYIYSYTINELNKYDIDYQLITMLRPLDFFIEKDETTGKYFANSDVLVYEHNKKETLKELSKDFWDFHLYSKDGILGKEKYVCNN
jgi:hypothetical protein